MKISELLLVAAITKDFEITERKHYFIVKRPMSNLMALVSKVTNKIVYYVAGCYHSPFDAIDIDPKTFDELRKFASYMQEVLENDPGKV